MLEKVSAKSTEDQDEDAHRRTQPYQGQALVISDSEWLTKRRSEVSIHIHIHKYTYSSYIESYDSKRKFGLEIKECDSRTLAVICYYPAGVSFGAT
jgi:hypothetical protein